MEEYSLIFNQQMTLEESIAKLNLGELSLSQFPRIALQSLEKGLESESLLILAGMNDRDNIFEIREYLSSTLKELSVKSYESLDAAYILANCYVNKVKSGELNIIDGISRIKNECWDNCQNLIDSNEYLYDGIQFERIIGAWYEYYEIDEQIQWVKETDASSDEIKLKIEKDLIEFLLKWQDEFLNKELERLTK